MKKIDEYKIGYEAGAKEMYAHIYEYIKMQHKGESILLSDLAAAYLEFKNEMLEIEKVIQSYYEEHQKAFEEWSYGNPSEHWLDDNGDICILYESGDWWHYRIENGELIWW